MQKWVLKVYFSYLLCSVLATVAVGDELLTVDTDRLANMTSISATEIVANLEGEVTMCQMPRPEICYELFQPVCAVRQQERQCLTTPCPQIEKVVYPNDCKACADPSVIGFQAIRACPPR